jgi:hypothetical protein
MEKWSKGQAWLAEQFDANERRLVEVIDKQNVAVLLVDLRVEK